MIWNIPKITQQNFSYNFTDFDTYKWNVQTCDAVSTCAFATANYTLNITNENPVVNLITPETTSTSTTSSNTFNANATDDIGLQNMTLNIWNNTVIECYQETANVSYSLWWIRYWTLY